MRYFDYARVAREARIPRSKLEELCALVRAEFPGDDMMADLHILRACKAVRDGTATLEAVLQQEAVAAK